MIMNAEFVFPLAKEDLQTHSTNYFVEEVLSARTLANHFSECKKAYKLNSWLFILDHFDAFYSIIVQWTGVSSDLKEDAWELLLKSFAGANRTLSNDMEDGVRGEERSNRRNALKMLLYLVSQFMENFDVDIGNAKPLETKAKGRKRKQSSQPAAFQHLDWPKEVQSVLGHLSELLKFRIQSLWTPPVLEEEFVNHLGNICFRVLENTAFIKLPPIRNHCSFIIAHIVQNFNYARTGVIKFGSLLVNGEQPQPTCVLSLVKDFLDKHKLKFFVNSLLQELSSYSQVDLDKNTTGTNALCTFLSELATSYPEVAQQSLPHLKNKLGHDPYMMRNCVLSIIGTILLSRYLKCQELDAKDKNQMDKYLNILEEHLHDVNAHVRSKCLSIWLLIVQAKTLPVDRMGSLVSLLVGPEGSLMDTSCQARKTTLKILSAMLQYSPSIRIEPQQLQKEYEKEVYMLKQMMEAQDPVIIEKELTWSKTIIPKVLQVLNQQIMDSTEDGGATSSSADDNLQVDEDMNAEDMAKEIYDHFQRGKIHKAVKLFFIANETFVDNPIFSTNVLDDPPPDSQELSEDELQKRRVRCWTLKLKDIFMGDTLSRGSSHQSEMVVQIQKQQVIVNYLKQGLLFAEQVQTAIPGVVAMLGSSSPSDVLDSIEFLRIGHLLGIPQCSVGFKKVLSLIWSKEASVRDSVVLNYKSVFTETSIPDDCPPADQERMVVESIVSNLIKLVHDATLGEMLSLEKLVAEFVEKKVVNAAVIRSLCEKFQAKPGNKLSERRASIIILGFAASENTEIIKNNLNMLIKDGLSVHSPDLLLVEYTCKALQKLAVLPKAKGDAFLEPYRQPMESEIFQRLREILVKTVASDDRFWVPMMEQALDVIFKLSETPDRLADRIIREVTQFCVENSRSSDPPEEPETQLDVEDSVNDESALNSQSSKSSRRPSVAVKSMSSDLLAKLLSLVSQVALKLLVHLEVSVLTELKRRKQLKEEKTDTGNSRKSKDRKTETNVEEDLGLEGATADDQEADLIRRVLDSHVLYEPGNLLTNFAPIVLTVCRFPKRYPSQQLQAAASLALSKFMLVSSAFCRENLRILFTLAEKSTSEVIRANLFIALGDMTKRFPNEIVPWTENLYSRLRDRAPRVRLNVLTTLSHLILNDMVKVKGQISEMTTCLVDEVPRIEHLAKLFFHELANKGNALYNVMPDIISRLSAVEDGVSEDNFHTIMEILFPLIHKDARHCESLVDKLCARFRGNAIERQWRDLAYCLKLMQFNTERMVRKLLENLSTYADKLHEESVYQSFASIVQSAQRAATGKQGEMAEIVDDLAKKVEEYRTRQVDNEEAVHRAKKAATKHAKRKSGSRPRARARHDTTESPVSEVPPAALGRSLRKRPNVAQIFDSDDED